MIVLSISKNLIRLAGGAEAFEVEGETLGDCLADFVSIVPQVKYELFIASGDRLFERVQVTVNGRIAEGENALAMRIEDGDEIDIALKGH
jgi:hypothetical protein